MEHSEWIGKFTGIASLLLFVVANAYYPARLIANKFRPWSMDISIFFRPRQQVAKTDKNIGQNHCGLKIKKQKT